MNQTFVCDGPAYVLGVDAGGTRTRAVLADAATGRVLGEGASGPGNALTVPVEVVTEHLAEAIGEAVRGVAPGRIVAAAGGFAGAASVRADEAEGGDAGAARGSGEPGRPGEAPVSGKGAARESGGAADRRSGAMGRGNDEVGESGGDGAAGRPGGTEGRGNDEVGESGDDGAEGGPGGTAAGGNGADEEPGRLRARAALTAALERLGIPLPPITIHSDIEAAFAGAPGHPAAGLALIAGTGSVAARVRDRVLVATSGGDGWLLGDDGSGFWIGRRAVRAALRAADGRGRPTSLVTTVGRALGVPEGVLPPLADREVRSGDGTSGSGAQVPGVRDVDLGPESAEAGRRAGEAGSEQVSGQGAGAARGVPLGGSARSEAEGEERAVGLGAGGGRCGVRTSGEGSAGAQPSPCRRDGVDDAARQPAEAPAPDPYRWSLAQRAAYRAHLLPAVMERRPTDLAAHAPLVTRAAGEGDEVARQILDEAAAALVETVLALAPEPGEPLVVTGGLLAPDGPLLAPLTEHLAPLGLTVSPVVDGSAGAVALARIAAAR
ncbi:BadF/BadG/BcrA/BcrD ATPase family protein [Streptomyces niveiscabiei]|uniref:BadF/BadG/BcrA/BcrD ATPase family protein n=1 Tax=Streptomyces niveiscabiei TaxID=164115 RepID=UPI0029B9B1B9|nr:BadF/BadG/BcrA/BcrD ATPase family protein [Streptomyces niveiscabiei]MDX3383958.1 BadF/BadG/BcrA/BcrD ATPase family protein [Streptomyces niveiscabiei]